MGRVLLGPSSTSGVPMGLGGIEDVPMEEAVVPEHPQLPHDIQLTAWLSGHNTAEGGMNEDKNKPIM